MTGPPTVHANTSIVISRKRCRIDHPGRGDEWSQGGNRQRDSIFPGAQRHVTSGTSPLGFRSACPSAPDRPRLLGYSPAGVVDELRMTEEEGGGAVRRRAGRK